MNKITLNLDVIFGGESHSAMKLKRFVAAYANQNNLTFAQAFIDLSNRVYTRLAKVRRDVR